MTTTLVLVLDHPTPALHDDDPNRWLAGFVRAKLMEAGLTVHECDMHAEYLLGAERPPVPTPTPSRVVHTCEVPWCRKPFGSSHLLGLHMRSHQQANCQHCGRTFSVNGLLSHERACCPVPAEPPPAPPPERKRERPVPAPKPKAEPPPMPDPFPFERRPFDPEKVRAAAGAGSGGLFG